jgi:hypothetical protein
MKKRKPQLFFRNKRRLVGYVKDLGIDGTHRRLAPPHVTLTLSKLFTRWWQALFDSAMDNSISPYVLHFDGENDFIFHARVVSLNKRTRVICLQPEGPVELRQIRRS